MNENTLKNYILGKYKEPICWKYSNEYRTRFMYSDRRIFDETNIVILYKYKNCYYIDNAEYYEYGDNISGFTSLGFHIDVVETIEANNEDDAIIKFVNEIDMNMLGPSIDLKKIENNLEWQNIIVDNINYLYKFDDQIYFMIDNIKEKFVMANIKLVNLSVKSIKKI